MTRLVSPETIRLLNTSYPAGALIFTGTTSNFLRGSLGCKFPLGSDIQDARLALQKCINTNPAMAHNLKFTALMMITEYLNANIMMAQYGNANILPKFLEIYAEVLESDLSLINEFDDTYSSLVVAAAINNQLGILQILNKYNASMQAVIPANLINLGYAPGNSYAAVIAEETAAHTYLRCFQRRMILTDLDLDRAAPIMNILLYDYTAAQLLALQASARDNHLDKQLSQIIDAVKNLINSNIAKTKAIAKETGQNMLLFVSPRTVRKHECFDKSRVLRNFLDRCGDGNVTQNIYSFLKPKAYPKPKWFI